MKCFYDGFHLCCEERWWRTCPRDISMYLHHIRGAKLCLMRGNGVENFVRNDKVGVDQIYKTMWGFVLSHLHKASLWGTRFSACVSDVGAKNNICEKVSPAPACNLLPLYIFCSVTFELWLEIHGSLSSVLFSVFALRFSDYIRGMLKLILVLMFAGASLAATWFTLTCLTRLTHLPSTKGILCWKQQYVLPCAHPQNCRPAGSLVGERWHRQAAIVSVRGSQRSSLSPDQWREKGVGL